MMDATTTKNDGGRLPLPNEAAARRAQLFMSRAAEFFDSALVLVVMHPRPEMGDSYRMVFRSGLPQPALRMAELYLDGALGDGSWYMASRGVAKSGDVYNGLPEEDFDVPAEWIDPVAGALALEADAFLASLTDGTPALAAGAAVLCTAGGGPAGTTKALCMTAGNSMACAGAMEHWIGEMS